MRAIKHEIRVFFTAIMFYTRIPCPSWVDHSSELINKSSRYFSLIGIIVGAFGGFVYWLGAMVFTPEIAVLLSMATTIWITGAFHEDGLADVFDGFGGGWSKEQILEIMKDSRLGTFGVIGLLFMLTIKFLTLVQLEDLMAIPLVLISGHALSRLFASTLISYRSHVTTEASKTKPIAKGMKLGSLLISGLLAVIPLYFYDNLWVFASLPLLLLISYLLGVYFQRKIKGYTGDCLGATQQFCEVVFYLFLHTLWKFS